ncbi:MAG TPA: ABC transporter substrate-binding protein [Segeticoccus sp.]|uniref:ABC transporter substrate-binding protein n=1 Tax=Segeticoccus sp. TaxID=2706531 RepID=UPI002D7E2532|nr:ABC transporter substrate-binding protein [Segeticoccus sp.]HET8601216.1 ABC transporter substrate-binding protein [Segeticoccus sp.]
MGPSVRGVKKGAAASVGAVSLALVAAGCGGSSSASVAGVDVVQKDALTVCTHLPYKPFQYRDSKGKVVGFDVDMIGLLSKELGVKQATVDVDWNQVTSGAAFTAGKCDLGMGGMTITPERAKAILISKPYFNATQALLVRKDSPYKSLADLKGKKVAVQTDTTGQIYGNKYAKQYGYTTVTYDDFALEVNAVKAGTLDAGINDNGVLYDFAKDNPTTSVATEFNTGEKYGFAAKKNDANATKLMNKLDAAIAKAKQDGDYDKIYKKWFGTVPGNINK